ncbi:signal transducer and activator of transcription 6 [Corythoichthys intestinalis]|uniref:signal transducer and activator of transcription 6 n=1 Tax=Corythoichthys intestinalis TaxID=161448 RepID=UPI0025A5BBA0|nr:signal transducer and activator of transcription 6 [Corythoichthys intestinalis]XP_057715625.1 signal transducer and activator of transcription 6 [Corythoichthys intestinalis]XP_057715634.1 signal transducer and activator of transcription 6 [Corythoichthys intestinalis]XP_061802438.1 signal transducer and activator of transcription 5B-like [Nerophis lumbriciformis]
MAQWYRISQLIQYLPVETMNDLYPSATFPIEVRHFLSDWIEKQRWEEFALENVEQEANARALLDELIMLLQSFSHHNANVVDKMKLMQISRNMSIFQHQPLKFVVMVRDTLHKERVLLRAMPQVSNPPQHQQLVTKEVAFPSTQDVDHLVLKVLEVQELRQKIHQVQEELNWEKQNFESLQGTMDPTTSEVTRLQNHIEQLDYNLNTMGTKRFQLLTECVDCLDQCQAQLLSRLKAWRWEQYKATIGHPFDDNLNILQMWCEQLLGVNGKLRQELMLIVEPIPELQERLGQLLRLLVQSSLVVDKQPPQVIKTQSKFTTTLRYLLGETLAPGKPVVLKAQIINELQARSLNLTLSDNVGEVINNTAILEHNTASKSTCATFRNMSIKKIKRADRKGSESVTEEKFALLFSTEITVTGSDTPFKIQIISLPLVIIVHGSQDNNALATIIWDCAFSEPDRVPFVVPERVPWKLMCSTLNSKFTSEIQSHHNLDQYNQHFLAQKIFDKPDFTDDFSNMMVSWTQFNKEVLPGRQFTFWQWFEGVIDLTKKHLRTYWSDGLIFGFIGKQYLHLILKQRPNGTFLLRFSDSEIGGITIAYVAAADTGEHNQIIKNIQPFTKRDLDIRSLGDRIRDISDITFLYPDFPKHDVFKKYYSEPQTTVRDDYIPVSLQTKVGSGETNSVAANVATMSHHAENHLNAAGYPVDPASVSPCVTNMTHHAESSRNAVGYPLSQFQQFTPQEAITQEQMENSDLPAVEFSPDSAVFSDLATGDMDLDGFNSLLNFS